LGGLPNAGKRRRGKSRTGRGDRNPSGKNKTELAERGEKEGRGIHLLLQRKRKN